MPSIDHIPAIKCTAHRTNGEPCQAWAIRGSTVCRKHGGNLPQVKAKAEERVAQIRAEILFNLAPTAISKIAERLESDDDRVVIKAAEALLDRAGVGPVRTSNATVKQDIHIDGDLDDQILTLLREALDGQRAPAGVDFLTPAPPPGSSLPGLPPS